MFAALVLTLKDNIQKKFFEPTSSKLEQGVASLDNGDQLTTLAQDLVVPWEIAFLPDGDMLVTERPGTLKRIGKNNQTHVVEGVQHTSEGGLLGLALHPDFQNNHFIYLYLTSRSGAGLINRVDRYRYEADRLSDKTVIITNIPGASNHDGGRIKFGTGPANMLYIATGDAGNEGLAQDKNSLAGKILKIHDDGRIPADNPFGNAVYSYGHRNVQGLAWDDSGRLWATEHGRSGASSGFDELNVILKGANYGWPIIEGDEKAEGMLPPVAHSGASETWAPASLAYLDGSLFFGGLRGESLYEARIERDTKVSLKAHFHGEIGRIRAVVAGPGWEYLYFTTSNTDGRGQAKTNDDKLFRIKASTLNPKN